MDIDQTNPDQMEGFCEQLDELMQRPLLVAGPPRNQRLTLLEAMEVAGQKELAARVHHALRVLRERLQVTQVPIIGVLGQLNAGKSSVVASFLSPAGRQRLPRGLESRNGTHRFVYWLPESWKEDPTIREAVAQLLAEIHGHAPELLSEDPEKAAAQYRSGEKHPEDIPVPLIAYDPGLRTCGLLDCLDVQTRDAPGALPCHQRTETNRRLEFVAQAARICSAFWVVWQPDQVRDRLLDAFLGRIRQVMCDVPLYLLVNKIRPYPGQPGDIYDDENIQAAIKNHRIAGVYGSFDFEIPGWEERTPAGLVQLARERLPAFFRLSPAYLEHPQSIPDSDWLCKLYHELEPSHLHQLIIASHFREIRQQARACHQVLKEWMDTSARKTEEAYRGLLQFLNELFADPQNEPIQISDPEFFSTLKKEIVAKGPWYVRLAYRVNNYLHNKIQRVREFASRQLPLIPWVKEIRNQTGVHVMAWDAELLAQRIRDRRFIPEDPHEWSIENLTATWTTILRHFQQHFQLEPDPNVIQQMAEDIWREQGKAIKWKSLFGVLGYVVGIAGLFTALVDGGATMLAGFSMASSLAAALSGNMALTVAMIGTGITLAVFYEGLIKQNSLPALAAMFEVCCDAFGLPREVPNVKCAVTFGRGEGRRNFDLRPFGMPSLEPARPLSGCGFWTWTEEGHRWKELVGCTD